MRLESKVADLLNEFGETIFSRSGDVASDKEIAFSEFVSPEWLGGTDHLDTEGLEQALVKLVEQVGGEGEGDTYFYILEFSEGAEKVLVRLNAFYSSYNGADYRDWDFVKPVQVMVTQYEQV